MRIQPLKGGLKKVGWIYPIEKTHKISNYRLFGVPAESPFQPEIRGIIYVFKKV
jgi:hypothetical protein